MRTFCIGDIHGAHKALLQCLERSGFNKEEDLLITLGDIVDGWSEVVEVVDELLTIENRIDIRGNHDQWFVDWTKSKFPNYLWVDQGGRVTLQKYQALHDNNFIKFDDHLRFFDKQRFYYIDDQNRLFVHGGCDWHIDISTIKPSSLMWDRHMYEVAVYHELLNKKKGENLRFTQYNEIFVGHTSTTYAINPNMKITFEPLKATNLWNLDQGAGWDGKLSIMNVDTKEFWQSDLVKNLYKEEKGRMG